MNIDENSTPTKQEIAEPNNERLPSLIERAATGLSSATSAAEILDARDQASLVYDLSKKTAHLAKMRGAHDEVITACHRAQADALVIEAQAKCRLADEYDKAQERGEVQQHGGQGKRDIPDGNIGPSVKDIGLNSKQIHEARVLRDAEQREPGIVEKTIKAKLDKGEEPTRAHVKRATRPKTGRTRAADGGRATARNAGQGTKHTPRPATHIEILEVWGRAPAAEQMRAVNGIGETGWRNAIPENWNLKVNAALRAEFFRIRSELESQNAELRQQLAHANARIEELAQIPDRREIARLKQELAQANLLIKKLRTTHEVLRHIEIQKLQQQLQRARAANKPSPSDVDAKLRATIKKLRERLCCIADTPKGTLVINKADRRKLLAVFHPDKESGVSPERKAVLTEAFKIFSGLRMVEVEPEEEY